MRNRGTALIVVLGILLIATTFLGLFLSTSGIRMKTAKRFYEQLQSHYVAQAGIETAISHIVRGEETNSFSNTVGEHGKFEVAWEKAGESENSFNVKSKGIIGDKNRVISETSIHMKLRKQADEIFIESWHEG